MAKCRRELGSAVFVLQDPSNPTDCARGARSDEARGDGSVATRPWRQERVSSSSVTTNGRSLTPILYLVSIHFGVSSQLHFKNDSR